MENSIMLVGEADEVIGFRLGGIRHVTTITSKNKQEVHDSLKGFRGLLLLTKNAAKHLGDTKDLETTDLIIHTLAEGEGDEYDTIHKIVKDTIGFDLKNRRDGRDN